ncbi:MAG: hypothetical protein ACYTGB_05070 [Planctomycetota bacterium]|jgi:hypothetical protein
MGTAYTPGLTVSARTVIEKTRRLPIKGQVLVQVGQEVAPADPVARAELPGDIDTQRLAEVLGLEPGEVAEKLKVKEGDVVEEGQLLAESRFFFGLFRSRAEATASGKVDFFSPVTGHLGIRKAPTPVEVNAYVSGTVKDVIPEEGVVVRTTGAMVQGIFGVGPERTGRVMVVSKRPDEELKASHLPSDCRGAVVVGGACAPIETLRAAAEHGAVGLVIGGLADAVLTEYLGRRIGVAVTGNEDVPLTVILTEGFGRMPMAARTFELFTRLSARECSLSGATQIRAGVQRPEVVVPIKFGEGEDVSRAAGGGGLLEVGTPVRVIRVPYFGQLGEVVDLPAELETMESGSKVRVLKARLADGEVVTVPRANVEIIET